MSKMKYSGVEWIGYIPNEWNLKRIKYNLLQPITDGPHETPIFIDDGIPFLSVDSIQNNKLILGNRYISFDDAKIYDKKCKPQYGDILMGKAASIGKIAIVDIKDYFQIWSPLALIRTNNNKLFNRFLMYYLESSCGQEYIENLSTKNTQKNIAMEDIEKIKIIIPNIKEQKLIANFLDEKVDELDEIINSLNKQLEILNNYKKSIITEKVIGGLNSNVKMRNVGTDSFKYIPNHWNIKRMQDIGEYKKGPFGSSITIDMFVEKNTDTVKVYEQKNAINNDSTVGHYYITKTDYNKLKEFEVFPNDIIVSCAGTIGKCMIMPLNMERGIINQALMKITLKDDVNKFYFLYLFDIILDKISDKYSNGSAIKNIPPFNILKKYKIPYPPLQEQNKIVEYLDEKCEQINKIIEDKQKQIEKIEEYKKSVIYEYVTGKKRVEGAEELYG